MHTAALSSSLIPLERPPKELESSPGGTGKGAIPWR